MSRLFVLVDSWRFWVGVAYVGLAVLVVILFRLNHAIAEEQARNTAEQRSAAIAQVESCYQNAADLPDLLTILETVHLLSLTARDATQAALDAMPESELTPVRKRSIRRYNEGVRRISKFALRFSEQRKTPEECDALARRLNVPVKRQGGASG